VGAGDQQPISEFGILGPVVAFRDGEPVKLRGPKHRALLARLIVARGEVVSVDRLIDDLSTTRGAIRTFVSDLRQELEPGLLLTHGAGYALRTAEVDAWRFEQDLDLRHWRGRPLEEFDAQWARIERSRLEELRLQAIRADVAQLETYVAEHPWHEEGWRLLALALAGRGRRGDALAVLRRAHTVLDQELGISPGAPLRRLQQELLEDDVFTRATAAVERLSPRARLESTVGLLRELAITGDVQQAASHRVAAITAAEELGDPELTARVITAYDLPAIWTRADDPAQAAAIVGAAKRALRHELATATQARLHATIALEARGLPERAAAARAEELARELEDPQLLAFALNGVWMQSFDRAGRARQRDAIASELLQLATRHGLLNFEILAHLMRMQARSALGDFATADEHADAADRLDRERPLVKVFTTYYREMRAGTFSFRPSGMPGLDADLQDPTPRPGLLYEARLCQSGGREALRPAADEWAAGSAILNLGRVADYLR